MRPPVTGGGFSVRWAKMLMLAPLNPPFTDMNLPLAAVAALLVSIFLTMRQPSNHCHWTGRLRRIDWGCAVRILCLVVSPITDISIAEVTESSWPVPLQ